MYKDHLDFLVKNVDTQLFEIINNLICTICQELFNKPVTTPCGHSFCNGCIKRFLSSKNNSGCPLCKSAIKRYGIETNEAKSTLTRICQELPAAFEKDVKDLTNSLPDFEDLITTSKLFHLQNQDNTKEITTKQKPKTKRRIRKTNKSGHSENDSESYVPILKRTKNPLEYLNSKKKRMGDLVSISQTEPASNSSGCEFELDKKLQNIEKVSPEKKVSEWFNAVGDNIYINSPKLFSLDTESENGLEGSKKEEEKLAIIRENNSSESKNSENGNPRCEEDLNKPDDPYVFIPSQNSKISKKRQQKRSKGKKVTDLKVFHSFRKETTKRNITMLDYNKEEISTEENMKTTPSTRQITASQKFDQLLLETKKQEKKSHILYSVSQSSSMNFLDVSFHSKEGIVKKNKTPKIQKELIEEENVLFKSTDQCSGKKEKMCLRSKRKSAEIIQNRKKKKLFIEIMKLESNETPLLEKSCEKHLVQGSKTVNTPQTKLEELLKELLDDDIIYSTRPANETVRLHDINQKLPGANAQSHLESKTFTQSTELIGFCISEETTDEKKFKQMVKSLEKELTSNEYILEESKELEKKDCQPIESEPVEENSEIGLTYENINSNNSGVETKGIIEKRLVEFIHLGRLTPPRKRTKSTVVKLVFPIGLASLAKRRTFESKCAFATQVNKKQARQVSMGIQTSQQAVSSLVQTSQVPRSSAYMQTSQKVSSSAEVQTTQKLTTSAEIQTSQKSLFPSEIQKSQAGCEFAQVQTSHSQLSETSNSKWNKTPIRKPSRQHCKIIEKRTRTQTVPDSQPLLSTPKKEEPLADKDIIMDFGIEKEFEDTWRNTQKTHQDPEEPKNEDENKQDEKLNTIPKESADVDSDNSDILSPKKKKSFKVLSQDSADKDDETRKCTPVCAKEPSQDKEIEFIDLETPGSLNSEEQISRVLKNIDLDLPKEKSGKIERGEKSEDSDSDFFVEQTPPKSTSRAPDDFKNVSKSHTGISPAQKQLDVKCESEKKENSEGADFIGDSIPKGFSESFLLVSAPQKIALTLEKNSEDKSQKKPSKIESVAAVDLPNENDQNQLNAFEGKTKIAQLKAAVEAWKQTEVPSPVKTNTQKKLCVVASGLKNPDMVKKFVSRFKIEYLNKPTKSMTHLIVGLHENDCKEVLPLCTPKFLFAMANRKWVVSESWAESCLKMNMILPEDTFETLDPVGGNGCRKARLSSEKLLRNCEIYLLEEFQMISKEEFADLIIECGGVLVPAPEKFSFLPSKLRMIIADRDYLTLNEKQLLDLYHRHSTVVLSRDVIIMSIQSYTLVNLYPYLLHPATEENLVKLGYPLPLVKAEEEEGKDESNCSSAR